jgi:hypothetical protein
MFNKCAFVGKKNFGDYTVYYSRSGRAERDVAIVVHKKMVRSVVKKTVCKRQDHCRTEK